MSEQGQCIAAAFGYPWCIGKCQNHQDCTAKPRNATDEIERLTTENWQLKQACGYPIPADKETPQNPFRCGICDARNKQYARPNAQFYLGKITDGAGNEIADEAFLTFGSAHGQNDGDCEINIKGGRAHEAADLISAIERLRAQRDQLLAALKRIDNESQCDRAAAIAQAAIAAVEEKP
jgi:hypothetical protein